MYIHIPFCKQLCSYCDFYFSVSQARTEEMLVCLMREMEIRAAKGERLLFFNGQSPRTLYFGGGTPTIYPVSAIKRLSDKAMDLFFDAFPEEWTVEANPDDLCDEYVEQLAEIGVNRLSIGIQSFIDRDLQLMRRRHSALAGIEAVERAKKAGFKNISVDLIYGFPGMSDDEWKFNTEKALSLEIQHISAYHLSIENRTVLGKMLAKGKIAPIDDELSDLQYKMLEHKLIEAGYIHYEISNFALPGFFSRHNSAYWEKQPYIGIGPSAHGYDGGFRRTQNAANNIRYIESINRGIIPEEIEILSERDCYNESLITALRTLNGLSLDRIPENFRELFLKKAERHLSSGAMIFENTYKIPSKYFLISDSIISDLAVI